MLLFEFQALGVPFCAHPVAVEHPGNLGHRLDDNADRAAGRKGLHLRKLGHANELKAVVRVRLSFSSTGPCEAYTRALHTRNSLTAGEFSDNLLETFHETFHFAPGSYGFRCLRE